MNIRNQHVDFMLEQCEGLFPRGSFENVPAHLGQRVADRHGTSIHPRRVKPGVPERRNSFCVLLLTSMAVVIEAQLWAIRGSSDVPLQLYKLYEQLLTVGAPSHKFRRNNILARLNGDRRRYAALPAAWMKVSFGGRSVPMITATPVPAAPWSKARHCFASLAVFLSSFFSTRRV
jgi:hypothetical protein